jgi:hypothetical protein
VATDIKRYGDGELDGDYYWVKEPTGWGGFRVASLYIDGLGKTSRVAVAAQGTWSPEDVDELPTKQEAIALHLSRAFDRAEANRKAWLRHREKQPKPKPKPPPMDRATRRFLS